MSDSLHSLCELLLLLHSMKHIVVNYLKFVFIFWLAIVKLLLTAVRLNNKIPSFFLNVFVSHSFFFRGE